MTESITLKFAQGSETDVVSLDIDWDLNTIDPLLVVEALRDLADSEERSYLKFLVKQEGPEVLVEANDREKTRRLRNNVN